ncbi:protein disulfide isomerase-like 1-6 isoform X1 [Magnolia sinica]|uniref:protein disulfide isomerase-like 1-6 isoform X1 n=1 Tax=Magnolia sinica TaxID=86752 RepID=UPI0026595D87|nr:protein disulfide isomerase-like 1-6 isoform X1 [Magnolia sinica]
MPSARPTSILIPFILALLLFLSTTAPHHAMHDGHDDDDDDDADMDGLEELLAVDKEVEEEGEEQEEGQKWKSSEAEVLSRAQRIVLQLTNENARQVIDGNDYVLLLGFAPWCHRSAEMMPHFAGAAAALKEMGSPVLLAKLDAERYPKAAGMLGIKGFPTLQLFVNGSAQLYTGGFSGEEIVIWTRKKTGNPVIRLSSVTEAEKFLEKHRIFAIGLFENFEGPDYEEFVKVAIADNSVQFVETCNIEVAAVLFPDVKPKNHFLGLVKSEPEKYEIFEDAFEESKILQFLDYNKFPLVTVLTDLNSVRLHSSPIKLQVYIFAVADDFKNLLVMLQDVARKFKTKIMFVYADTADDDLAKPFLTLFGLDSEKPIVTAFDYTTGSKYLLESEPTSSNLEEFCSGLLHGTLSPYYRSDPISDTKGIVQAVVGRSFDAVVLNSPENVLLEVYTPWCMTCEKMSKEIEKLATHFKGVDNLLFARIDASSNEHPKLQINDFPTVLFYPSGNKSNPIKVSAKSSLKDLIAFINANVKAKGKISTSEQTVKDEL